METEPNTEFGPFEKDNLRPWVAEAERRLSDLRAGVADEVPAEDVLRRARAATESAHRNARKARVARVSPRIGARSHET